MAAGEVRLTFDNVPHVRAALERYAGDKVRLARGALFREGERIMTRSKEVYVPVITGNLRDSGHVQRPEMQGTLISVTLGFGGAAAPYALTVHEAPESWGQGKHKYLEKPVREALQAMDERLAADMRSH